MTYRYRIAPVVLCLFAVTVFAPTALAQTDRLFPTDGDMVLGKIKSVSKSGVVLTVSGKDQTFPAGTITKILFQGDPTALTEGRESALDGQFDQALEELRTLKIDDLPRDVIKADAQFYIVLSQAKQALAGRGDLASAAKSALNFARSQSNSWRFFDVAKLLGDLAAAAGNADQALKYYGSLRSAPSPEMKIQSVYETSMVQLSKGDIETAQKQLQQIVGLKVTSAESVRLKNLAKAGLAVALARGDKQGESNQLINEMIETLNPADTVVAARIYNAQGAAMEAAGDDEGAILAYLHTHLMFSSDAESHVLALRRLADLWTRVGKPDRAAQARGELQQRYPGLSG